MFVFINHKVWTLDANKRELTRLGFSSSGDSLLRDEAVILDEDILRPLDFAIYNDTTFIIPDYSGENRLCWLNDDGELVKKIGAIHQLIIKRYEKLVQHWHRHGVVSLIIILITVY